MEKSIAAALMLFASVAGSPATTPRQVVQAAVDRVIAVLEGVQPARERGEQGEGRPVAGLDDRARAEIRRVAHELFDFDEMARRALSQHWNARTRPERAEFVRLFADLLERSYLGRIEAYAGERIVYVGESLQGESALVRSKIVPPRPRRETALDYRLHRRDGRWQVDDVLVDGVGLVSTYRAEFNRLIRASSYRGLVDALRDRRLPPAVVGRR